MANGNFKMTSRDTCDKNVCRNCLGAVWVCKTVQRIYAQNVSQFDQFITSFSCQRVKDSLVVFTWVCEVLSFPAGEFMHGSVRQFGRSLCCHVKCVFVVFLLVLLGSLRCEMSGDIPKDPSELAKWLRWEKNLRSDICKVLKGKQFSNLS